MKTVTLIGEKQQNELKQLVNDPVLKSMADEVHAASELHDVPYRVIQAEYTRRGGLHQPLTIGSFKEALFLILEQQPKVGL